MDRNAPENSAPWPSSASPVPADAAGPDGSRVPAGLTGARAAASRPVRSSPARGRRPARAGGRSQRVRAELVVVALALVAAVVWLLWPGLGPARSAAAVPTTAPDAVLVTGPAAGGPPGSDDLPTPGPETAAEVKDAADPAPPSGTAAGVEGLDPDLAERVTKAIALARADGVELRVTSGRRTAREQQALVDDAVKRYGSEREAHRWVLPPEQSAHVRGLAVDMGPAAGARWLEDHALSLGLCRVYANEAWHFELLPDGAQRCPALLPDSSSGWD